MKGKYNVPKVVWDLKHIGLKKINKLKKKKNKSYWPKFYFHIMKSEILYSTYLYTVEK